MNEHAKKLPECLRATVSQDGGINARPRVFYENTPNRAYVELIGSFGLHELRLIANYIEATQDDYNNPPANLPTKDVIDWLYRNGTGTIIGEFKDYFGL